jgi:FkbM family methyltransferase
MNLKNIIRSTLIFLKLDLTKNLEYDRLTQLIMKRVIADNSNCIDVGCHKGEILDLILKFSPKGKHFAFEPIPYLFNQLENKYINRAVVYPFALSDKNGETTFNLVKNAPAYSGINKRQYNIAHPDIEEIKVELRKLDEVIPRELKIDFIKIDVEGGEFGVLKGARELMKKNLPVVVFECGMGASDYYGTNPLDLYNYLVQDIGLQIFTLKSFIKGNKPLSVNGFEECFKTNSEYYFIASRS